MLSTGLQFLLFGNYSYNKMSAQVKTNTKDMFISVGLETQ